MLGALIDSILYPGEIQAMVNMKYGGHFSGVKAFKGRLEDLPADISDWDFCYAVLNKVSRSFALVIQELPETLKDGVCIFYLVLRGLDSVEDDQDVELGLKLKYLRRFSEEVLTDPTWSIDNVGDTDDYRYLMTKFDRVTRCYQSLSSGFQKTIADITTRMGNGMADFVEKEKVVTTADYDLYCHYVAGLVGIGLIQLFSESGLEDPQLREEEELANRMGLFLQKTNIIRDYLEDLDVGRVWWPVEVYQRHGFADISDIRANPSSPEAQAVLQDLVCNAVELIPDCLRFMSLLKHPQIFKFCAIPQVMAIATLEKLYNNPRVYTGVVKIRKGTSCYLILHTENMAALNDIFADYSRRILYRVNDTDYNAEVTRSRLREAIDAARLDPSTPAEYGYGLLPYTRDCLQHNIRPVLATTLAAGGLYYAFKKGWLQRPIEEITNRFISLPSP
mmetsp:Transcript_12908/g.36557  ORF Transcript_12908/g.36557 Transcript_12908/m.36557 type:complete len:448 (+) Transcript_12908:106-1449(+)|eukprot:CAMPEP_0119126672 /NCGR_PEP_ID=MMETSP1310-20130426/5507_1 /TAXON_ID=464262 /ORGANISM="Genus nov. species nov., Strain RCC2339" /LENGTH=447 /DNA_ID=CAMNT_0007116843 /DNA_START=155 /DNA_END=1498 /DNA_ORIENTATION=+